MDTVALERKVPDYKKWNERLNASWSCADYARIGVTLQITGEELAEAANFRPGSHILDVAAGNGNATLAVSRRFCEVTSTDYVQPLLDKGRARVEAEGLEADFRIADAQDLPFVDNRFDGVISTFGAMFAPDQQATASELLRVCKPGGQILLLEHGRGHFEWINSILDSSAVQHAQKWGCWFNRPLDRHIEQSGLIVDSMWRWHFGTTYYVVAAPCAQGAPAAVATAALATAAAAAPA